MAGISGLGSYFQEAVVVKILGGAVCPTSRERLTGMMSQLFPFGTIQVLSSEELHFHEAFTTTHKTLLVFPGAENIRMWNLSNEQQLNIKSLCQQGRVRVLGVCAGGYYCSKDILYHGMESTFVNRYCKLFRGTCDGPLFPHALGDHRHLCTRQVYTEDGEVVDVAMNGGGMFMPDSTMLPGQDYRVLATYADHPAAIAALACVRTPDGNYGAVLVGPHFEYEGVDFRKLSLLMPEHMSTLYHMGDRIHVTAAARLRVMRQFLCRMGFT